MTSKSLRHIAIIMDGNNRWAKQRGLSGVAGHKEGAERIRDILSACQELGVEVLTLFAFSSENWKRPRPEVEALLSLFHWYLKREVRELAEKGIRLRVIGDRSRFSASLREAIEQAERSTQSGQTELVIAADYGGRWDITQAARRMAERAAAGELDPASIDEGRLHRHTSLGNLPAPDLLIRTGGEVRISNFLLWHCAYTELYFTPVLWPDFGAEQLKSAADDFYGRQRRFGRTADQLEQRASGGERHA